MNKQPDLTYTDDGMFTRFIPMTDQGFTIYQQMIEQAGTAAFLNVTRPSVLAQIRAAGYTVRKSKKATKAELDEILAELDA